jgi:hypothetical protein
MEWIFKDGSALDEDTYDLLYQWENGNVNLDEFLDISQIEGASELLRRMIESTEGTQDEEFKDINRRAKRSLKRLIGLKDFKEIAWRLGGTLGDID